MANNRYQSGGKGFNSVDTAMDSATQQMLLSELGGTKGIGQMSMDDAVNAIHRLVDTIQNKGGVGNTDISSLKDAIDRMSNNADNVPRFIQSVEKLLSNLGKSNINMARGIASFATNKPDKDVINKMISSTPKSSLQLTQMMLKSLQNIEMRLGALGGNLSALRVDLGDMDAEDDKENQRNHEEEQDSLDSLKQTLVHAALNSPTATALNQLGASLITTGLYKVAGNENMPDFVRKMAMSAVYLEVPQTLMNMLTQVVSLRLANFLDGKATKIMSDVAGGTSKGIKGMMGNLGGLVTKAIPVMAGVLIAAGIFAGIKGIIDHKKQMKENDVKIENDPNLTRGQKDLAKLQAHTASGAKKGALAGGLSGAGIGMLIGTLIAPGIGTAIGGAIGGGLAGAGLGAIGGSIIGAIKPLGQAMKHGLQAVGAKVAQGAKWAVENKDKIVAFLKPIGQAIMTIMTLASPFFLLFKMFYDKIMNSKLIQQLTGRSDNAGNADPNMSLGDKIKSAFATTKNYVTTSLNKDGFVNMTDLGLAGKIDDGNSVPKTLKKNAYNVQQLDYLLKSWGYDVTYTSNMGGQHKLGEKSHASGNKLDLQLKRGGKNTHLTQEQLNYLQALGYWGGTTGALGWEAVDGQVGGGHYDLHIGNQVKADTSDKQLVALRERADKQAQKEKKTQEREEREERKEQERLAKEEAKKNKEKGNTVVASGKPASVQVDLSGTEDYTRRERDNATNQLANVGG